MTHLLSSIALLAAAFAASDSAEFKPLSNGEIRDVGSGTFHFASASTREFYISNHDPATPRKVFIPIVGVTNAVLRGRGAGFVFHGEGTGLLLQDTSNIRIEGISFDWARPGFSEGEVLEVAGGRTRVAFDQRQYPMTIEDGRLWSIGEDWREAQKLLHPFAEDGTCLGIKWFSGKAERAADGTLWLDYEAPSGTHTLMIRNGHRPYPAVVLYRADDTHLEDITIHAAFGMALVAQRSSNVTMRGSKTADAHTCGVFPAPGRRTALVADATHFSNCKGRILIENCHFSRTVDDAMNVHATCLSLEEVLSPDRIRCRYVHVQSFGFETFRPGERVTFINGPAMQNGPVRTVRHVEWLDPKEIVLTIEGGIPSGFGKGDAVENTDFQPSVVFRNNTVIAPAARGCLLTTAGKVTVEGNVFERTWYPALLFSGDVQEWYESGSCNDVTIRGNIFRNLPLYPRSKGAITVAPQVKAPERQTRAYHTGFKIEDNIFEKCLKPETYGIP